MSSPLPVRKGVFKYLPSGRKGRLIIISILIAAFISVYAVVFEFGNIGLSSSEYNTGFIDGGVVARLDLQDGKSFNPACDPTSAFANNGQHSTIFCSGWTTGYVKSWNLAPKNALQTAIQGTSYAQRYAAGINDGGQTALSDLENGSSFNPTCDPRARYSSDTLHTTIYCNGWTKGYMNTWNNHHRSSGQ